jgi:superfamily II DNA or RNA helicase
VQETVIITKVNEAYVHIDVEQGVLRQLSEHFTFYVPGYQYMPAYKSRRWDGKLRLLNLRNHQIYYGLVPYIEQFCKEKNIPLVVDPVITLKNNFSIKEAEEFIDELKLPKVPRDYQIESFAKSIRNKRQLIISPTASGKSLIAYLISRYLVNKGKRGLIIVPTISLVEQLYKDFEDYSKNNKWNTDKNFHRIYGGQEKITKNITCSTWQSIYELPKEWFEQFDFVIGDECHLFKAKSLTTLMSKLEEADIRIGMTGTLDGSETHKLVLEGLFGIAKQYVTTEELIKRKQLAELKIKCLVLNYLEKESRIVSKYNYQEEIEYIIGYKPRIDFVKNLVLSLHGNTLILYQRVEGHGEKLYEAIKKEAGKRKVYFIHGGINAEERERARQEIDDHSPTRIILEFDKKTIECEYNEEIPLNNGKFKKAQEIDENDDIKDKWIINRL